MSDRTWGTNTDWQNASKTDVVVNNSTFSLGTAIPDSGIAKYAFEQDVTDSWNDNGLADKTSAGYVTGQVDSYAKDFNASQSDHCVQDPPAFDGSENGCSVAVWINWDSPGTITGKYDGSNQLEFGNSFSYFHWYTYDGSFHGHYGVDLGITGSSGTWYHIVGVWDGTDYIVYVDGTEEARASSSTFALPTGNFGIGAMLGSNGEYYRGIDGALDDMRWYNKGLTKTEVNNLKDGGSI